MPWTAEPQIRSLGDKQAPPAASALPGVLFLEDLPRGEGRFLECCLDWQGQGVDQSGAGWRSPPQVPGLDCSHQPFPASSSTVSHPTPQQLLPSQMFSVPASSTAAAHRPTAPRVPSSVTPATGWTQSAAQGGVSMDSHPGGPDNTGVGLQSPLIYFKDIPHTPSPSPFPWRDSLLLLAHLTLSLCPHGAGWEK